MIRRTQAAPVAAARGGRDRLGRVALLGLALGVGGCLPSTGAQAPLTATLNLPSDVGIIPGAALVDTADGYALLVILDVMVTVPDFDGTEVPASDVQVEVLSNWNGVYLLPKSAISVVDYPAEPAVDCTDPALWDESSCPWYDTGGGQYFTLANNYGEGNEDTYRPNYMIDATDRNGMLRVYALVDSMPYTAEDDDEDGSISIDEVSFSDAAIWFSIGHSSDVVLLTAESE